jgi:glyoxylase-like metal-dependent hydrolase (beta-lactamase superfamily II)
MTQQVPLGPEAQASESGSDDRTHEIRPDLAYQRLIFVNVIFYGTPGSGDRNWVLIDTGVVGTKAFIKRAAAARFGDGARPAAIIMTHGHFDHVGALEALAHEWEVPVYAHVVEHPYLTGQAAYPPGDASVGGGMMANLASLYPTGPVDVSAWLRPLPDDGSVPAMPGWRWLHTPGHSPGHISLWRASDRTLVAGDAFVTTVAESAYAALMHTTELHGPPRYFTIEWDKSKSSVETLAALNPELVITGHGRAMQGAEMTQALHTLARDFERLAVPENGKYVQHPARAEDRSAYLAP